MAADFRDAAASLLHKKEGRRKKNMKKKALIILIIVFSIALWAMIFYCIYNVAVILTDYANMDRTNTKIATDAVKSEATPTEVFAIDFERLREINPDIVGWLYSEGTSINYPVVKCSDNQKYLNRDFYGNYNVNGTLFIDCYNGDNMEDFNTIIYGHHMKDPKQSMFGSLKNYVGNQNYYKQHSKMKYLTPDKDYDIEIIAVCLIPNGGEAYETNFETKEEREKFIKEIQSLSTIRSDFEVDGDDKLMTLSTCAYEYKGARYVVIGKLNKQNSLP